MENIKPIQPTGAVSTVANLGPSSDRSIQIVFGLFWLWYVISAIAFLRGPDWLSAFGPISLSLIWWAVLWFRKTLQQWSRALSLPVWLKFLLIGLVFSDVIMENLAISFKGDLHPNLFWNSVLWLGAYAGVLLGWWLMAHFYALTPWQVFFIYGLKGVIVEQDFMVPLMIWKKQLLMAFLVIPYLMVVYAAAVAPVFVLLQDELPKPQRRLGWIGMALAILLPMVLFYAGAFIWFKAVSLLGLKVPV